MADCSILVFDRPPTINHTLPIKRLHLFLIHQPLHCGCLILQGSRRHLYLPHGVVLRLLRIRIIGGPGIQMQPSPCQFRHEIVHDCAEKRVFSSLLVTDFPVSFPFMTQLAVNLLPVFFQLKHHWKGFYFFLHRAVRHGRIRRVL